MRSLIQRALKDIPLLKQNGLRDIFVAMSGGVDSSVSAFLLQERGYNIHPITYKSWDLHDELDNIPTTTTATTKLTTCAFEKDVKDIQSTLKILGLAPQSLTIFDFVKDYWNEVFQPWYLQRLQQGYTPSPDIICNRMIKFGAFNRRIQTITHDPNPLFATGHYARIRYPTSTQQSPQLLKAIDSQKDQSYFLAGVTGHTLRNAIFPLGHITKTDVRDIAKYIGLPVAMKRSSRGICFIGPRKIPEFVSKYLPKIPSGSFVDVDTGDVLEDDVEFAGMYTVGQGARIGGCDGKYYVAKKIEREDGRVEVVVAKGWKHPGLFCWRMVCGDVFWIQGVAPEGLRTGECVELMCVTSNREKATECNVRMVGGDRLVVEFSEVKRRVGNGQAIVFYGGEDGEVCLGGAWIEDSKGLGEEEVDHDEYEVRVAR